MMKHSRFTVGMVSFFVLVGLFVPATWAGWPGGSRQLPEAVQQSVRKLFPAARISDVEHERRLVRLVEVTVVDNGEEYELMLSLDGTVLSIEREVDPSQLPAVVSDAVRRVAGSEKIREADQIKILAELRVVPIKEPRIEYKAEFRKKGKEQEVIVSEDGAILNTPDGQKSRDDD